MRKNAVSELEMPSKKYKERNGEKNKEDKEETIKERRQTVMAIGFQRCHT